MILRSQFDFFVVIVHCNQSHYNVYVLSFHSISYAKVKAGATIKEYLSCFKSAAPNNINRGNLEMIPEVAYNFREFREPLIGQDA